MSGRATVSWQTSLADLSLILFMVTAAAVSKPPPQPISGAMGGKDQPPVRQGLAAPPQVAEPLSVYIVMPGAPPLQHWLAEQAPDPRQQLTITTHYDAARGASREAALLEAMRLAREAARAGLPARLVLEPGTGDTRAVLAFDAPGEGG